MPTLHKHPFRSNRRANQTIKTTAESPSLGNRVASLRRALEMPRSQFARLLGRTERAVIDWESGKTTLQGLSRQRVRELERLSEALQELFDARELGQWFDTPNEAFGSLKPMEVIERGESDRLWQMIFQLKAGTHV
jgi:DNA-binding transcriptional regulator YiaG